MVSLWTRVVERLKSLITYSKLGITIDTTKNEELLKTQELLRVRDATIDSQWKTLQKMSEELKVRLDEEKERTSLLIEKDYWDNKWKKSPITYKGKDYDMDVRNYCYSKSCIIEPIVWAIIKKDDKEEEKVRKLLFWSVKNITYDSDSNTKKRTEYWSDAEEVAQTLRDDCEGGAMLLYCMLRIAGVPEWRVKLCAGWAKDPFNKGEKVGHCYLIYLNGDEWYTLDWCFVDRRRTRVQTTQGRKRFSELKVGDEVSSFNERTGKIETSKIVKIGTREVEETYRIYYINAFGKEESVECTKEHPFFVNGNWKKTEELKIGDEMYAISPKALWSITGNHKKTKEWIKKITDTKKLNGDYLRLSVRQRLSNVFTRKKVREKLSKNNGMKNTDVVERVFSQRMKSGYKSQPEKRFIDLIERLNIPVKYVGDGSFWVKGKNPDFKVEDERKVIEVTNYGYLGRDEKWARERIKHFEDNGFNCLVVFYDKNCKKCFVKDEEIVSFVMNGFKITKIKKLNQKRKVWNIHCEGNNNYFVNGILVHNCYYPNESLERLGVTSHRNATNYGEIWFTWNESWSWSGKDVDLTGRIKNTNSNSRRMK